MKKTKRIAIICTILILTIINSVYAISFKFIPQTEVQTAKPGDTVTIEFSVSDIDVGTEGINTIATKIKYDENVFEQIKGTDFLGTNNWSITYNEEEGEKKGEILAVIINDGVTTDQLIGKLNLKVKENIEKQQTKIEFVNIRTNDGQNEITNEDKEIIINIVTSGAGEDSSADKDKDKDKDKEQNPSTDKDADKDADKDKNPTEDKDTSQTPTQTPTQTQNPTQAPSSATQDQTLQTSKVEQKPAVSASAKSAEQDDSKKTSSKILPKTGELFSVIIFIIIIGASIFSIIMYNHYKKLKGL